MVEVLRLANENIRDDKVFADEKHKNDARVAKKRLADASRIAAVCEIYLVNQLEFMLWDM